MPTAFLRRGSSLILTTLWIDMQNFLLQVFEIPVSIKTTKLNVSRVSWEMSQSNSMTWQYADSALECENDSQKNQNRVSSKDDNGFQTDKNNGDCSEDSNDDLLAYLDLSRNLLSAWGSPFDQNWGRNVISQFFVACQTDLHLLFGSMGINISSKVLMELLADGRSSDAVLQYNINHLHTPEAARVSSLYFVLAKIVVIYSSFHVLRIFLQHLLTFERNSGRDNFLVEGLGSGNDVVVSLVVQKMETRPISSGMKHLMLDATKCL